MLIIGCRKRRPSGAPSAVTQTAATVPLTAGAVMRQEERLFQPFLCNLLPPQLFSSPCLRQLRTTSPLSQSQAPREMLTSCSSLSKGEFLVSYSILFESKHNVQINLRLCQTDHDVSWNDLTSCVCRMHVLSVYMYEHTCVSQDLLLFSPFPSRLL